MVLPSRYLASRYSTVCGVIVPCAITFSYALLGCVIYDTLHSPHDICSADNPFIIFCGNFPSIFHGMKYVPY
ncbi:hypothetical protein A0H81_05622 [Grifola frondosa]|uniref:Uncharacterized protein n=1 Tax=Grifola frondosa TaxID=5627 RepID=A0A1C7MCF1_GRIFR|nr:hypothetical protein A0H81_05622 [Grifola frondosa]